MRIVNRNRNNEPLTDEQIQKIAPSAFAGQAHESRSSRYAFVPTSDVISGLRDAGFAPVSASQSLSRIAGKELFTKHQLRFRSQVEQTRESMQLGDVSVEVIMTNSHDGTSLYDLCLGAYRKACMNGMFVSAGMVQSVRIKHSGNIIEQVVRSTYQLVQQAPLVAESIKLWKTITLTQPEQLFLAEGALALRFEDTPPVEAQRLLTVRRYADDSSDLWSTFNRVQEAVIRGGLRYEQPARVENNEYVPVRRNRTREVKGIDQNTRLNRELWALAQKMAELKSN